MNCLLEPTHALSKLGDSIRELMTRQNLSGVDLAAQIGLSATSLSQIVNGATVPRAGNFARILNRLAQTPEDRTALIEAYTGATGATGIAHGAVWTPPPTAPWAEQPNADDLPAPPSALIPAPESDASRYLEVKAASIGFREDIAHLLDEARIPCIHPFKSEKVACDFVTKGKTRIAVDCKFNLQKDWSRLLGTCLLLKKNLPADHVVVAIPYHNATSRSYGPDFTGYGIHMETPDTLIARLKKLGA